MERDKIIDTLKHVMILFVIIGHTLPKFMGGGNFDPPYELHLSISHAVICDDIGLFNVSATYCKIQGLNAFIVYDSVCI